MAELIASKLNDEIEQGTHTVQIGVDALEAYERGREDFNFFASLAMPEVMQFPLPIFYILCFKLIISRPANQLNKIIRFALGLPRGHAKTTFVKILLAWLIVYDRMRFIVVVCATEPNAQNILEDLSNILGSPNMEAVYGKWYDSLTEDNKSTKKAKYHNKIVILEAKGAGSAIRGLNKNNERPDLILLDDVQTRECAMSETENRNLMQWLVATLLKAIDTKGNRLVVYVGNMYNEQCILRKLQLSDAWISLITGAILEDYTPLWPELHSLESLMESYMHDESLGQADVWFAEVMNDPRSTATSLLEKQLPVIPSVDYIADGVFITIDPAGFRSTSDDSVIVTHEIFDSKGIIAKTDSGKFTPEETIKIAITRALEYGASVIGVETVGYQQSLKFWMEKYINELDITNISVVELKPHGRSKESRIRAFVAELIAGHYYHKNAEERSLFTYQAMAYKLGDKHNKDDLLDASAYGMDIRAEYWNLITNNLGNDKLDVKPRVQFNNTPF